MTTIGGIVVPTGTQASQRRSFLDVINELARPINNADETVRAQAADAFRAAVRRMNIKGNWPWEVQEEDVTITSGQRYSSLSSGSVKKPLRMHLLNSAGGVRDQPIDYMPWDRFVEKYTMDVSSDPHTYTIDNYFENGRIRWFPTPAANDNARFTYYRVTPAPTNEQEPVEVPDYAMEAYMAFAWYEFVKRLAAEQRPFPLTVALSERNSAFKELSAHVNSPGDRSRQIGGVHGGY